MLSTIEIEYATRGIIRQENLKWRNILGKLCWRLRTVCFTQGPVDGEGNLRNRREGNLDWGKGGREGKNVILGIGAFAYMF